MDAFIVLLLVIIIVCWACYRRKLSKAVYGIAALDIFLRIVTFIKLQIISIISFTILIYIFMILMAVIYISLLYKFGIKDEIVKNLDLIKYVVLAPMLVSAFCIDLKHRILPNRLSLTIFETGLILTFIYGITNINMAKDMILGMFAGAIIFIVLAILGKLITGKESVGIGDAKVILRQFIQLIKYQIY